MIRTRASILLALTLCACGGAPEQSGEIAAGEAVGNSRPSPWSIDAPGTPSGNKVAVGTSGFPRPGTSRTATGSEPASGGSVKLSRQSDGHFYASITVDSQDLNVLVDTGASIVALTGDDARSLGLDWSSSEIAPIGRGASGDVYGVPVTLDSVELDGIRASNVSAVIIPEGLDVTLLGQSFLSQVERVEIAGDSMVLHD